MAATGSRSGWPPTRVSYAAIARFVFAMVVVLVADLCHMVTACFVEQKQAMRGISLLYKAIRKIQLFDSQLTSVHADLCQLCLLAKCFKPALEILDIDITAISQEVRIQLSFEAIQLLMFVFVLKGGQLDAKYFLLYYYYGGMIYLAVRNLERALYCFEVAVTTPALAVSHIMLEAYKKYILVSLLLTGKVYFYKFLLNCNV